MFHYFVCFFACFMVFPVLAQTFSLSQECQEAVRIAESVRTPDIYDNCDFGNEKKALEEWAPWAEREKAGQALYEICIRHKKAEIYCQKAEELGNGSALLHHANNLYNQKDYTKAANFYTQALSSPLLTEDEKGQVAQNMGLLYMNPNSSYYNPAKGMPLIERAVKRRGAEANNLMGVYALFGMQNVPQNAEKSFEYLWRAILLGCPAAEENLGLWHLLRQKKISNKTVRQEMAKRMFSCVAPDYVPPKVIQKNDCDCNEVAIREDMASRYPYRLIKISGDRKSVVLLEKGKEIKAGIGTQLSNNMKINEIKKTAILLSSGNTQSPLNLAPVDDCPELCKQQKEGKEILSKTIKPYHLSFTHKECADILYYAERLVDTNLPFTGKNECAFSADMDKAADLLMNL